MLTRAYIEALLVDENLADQVWEAWDKADIGDLSKTERHSPVNGTKCDASMGLDDSR